MGSISDHARKGDVPAKRTYPQAMVFLHRRGFFLGSAPSGRLYPRAASNRNLVNIRHGQARFLFMRINITIGGEHP